MVTGTGLVCADTEDHARLLLARHSDFDVISIRRKGVLTAYMERGSGKIHDIALDDLITESTGLLEAVDVLARRRHAFVLVRDRVSGYIHFSDFNHPIVKVPFFILLEAVERRCFESLATKLSPAILTKALGVERFRTVEQKLLEQQRRRANLGWAAVLSFAEKLLCTQHLEGIVTNIRDIHSLSKVRNLVCHAGSDLLVESHDDIRRLVKARDTSYKILEALAT
jgi:hypothetical protein